MKIIDAIEKSLELNQGELNIEREVLREFGNMSAPTVLFVLEQLIERGLPERTMIAIPSGRVIWTVAAVSLSSSGWPVNVDSAPASSGIKSVPHFAQYRAASRFWKPHSGQWT